MPNLINELYDYAHKFESKYNDPIHSDINEMWQDFKEIVQKTIDRNIPSKLISGSKTNLPWITNSIRKMIRKRNAAYHKQKHSKEHADILVYKHLKRNVQTQIRKSYWENVESILSGDEASTYQTQNKFWKFIKGQFHVTTDTTQKKKSSYAEYLVLVLYCTHITCHGFKGNMQIQLNNSEISPFAQLCEKL